LAEQLLIIAGHDPAFWPLGWCGAPMRKGWEPDVIVAAIKAAARNKGLPAASIQYFEKAIAEGVARALQPARRRLIRSSNATDVPSSGFEWDMRGSLYQPAPPRLPYRRDLPFKVGRFFAGSHRFNAGLEQFGQQLVGPIALSLEVSAMPAGDGPHLREIGLQRRNMLF
jgi:hypothetical protein